MFEHINK